MAVHEYPMVIALFALSLVMIVGGVAAVVQGFPYVRLESGLAMVIGGATAASAGAVLLGISAAILQMKKFVEVLGGRGGLAASEPAAESARLSSAPFRATAFEEPAPIASEPIAATAGAAGLAGINLGAARDLLGGADRRPAIDPLPGRALEVEPPLPNLIPPAVPGPIPPPAPGEPIIADEDLFASPDDRPGQTAKALIDEPAQPDPAREELALRPALAEPPVVAEVEPPAPEASPAPPEPAAEEDKPKPEELQVVGTYSSGANTYVMFANGTIQADTPRGRFTFQSLDELKEFVDSGGETTARGAA